MNVIEIKVRGLGVAGSTIGGPRGVYKMSI